MNRRTALYMSMVILILASGCGSAAETMENESGAELMTQEETSVMSSVFDEPEYSYTPNHPYQSFTRYLNGTTYVATNRGLFAQQDDSPEWVRIDGGKTVGIGDVLEGNLFYSVGTQVKKISAETGLISEVYEGEDTVLKITAEKRDSGGYIYLFYECGYIEGLVLDATGTVKEVISMEENYRYESENKRYKKSLENPDGDYELSLSRNIIDPCFSRKIYGREYFSWWNTNQSGIDIRTLVSSWFEDGRGMNLELTDYFDTCMVTPWGIVFYDKERHGDIYLLSHEGVKKKKLWDGEDGHFSVLNYDEESLYGIVEKEGSFFISRIFFKSGEMEQIYGLKEKVDKLDILDGWIYYYNNLDMIERRKICSAEEYEIVS